MELNLNRKNFEVFLEIARTLNESLGIIPIIFGSLGLNRVIGEFKKANDIDILLPDDFVNGKFAELDQTMIRLGFQFNKKIKTALDHEYEFVREGDMVSFGPEEEWLNLLKTSREELNVSEVVGVNFKEFSAKQYLKIYQILALIPERQKKGKEDDKKISLMEEYLKRNDKF